MTTQVWNREAQSFSLETATRSTLEWTHAETRVLENMRRDGKSTSEIATLLNRSYYSVSTKLSNLGLTNRRSNSSPALPISSCATCFTTFSLSGACSC
jgi:DNA-binding CsgD family transcriptional regulator